MERLDGEGIARGDAGRVDALLEQLYRHALEVAGKSSLELREWVDRAEAWRIAQVLRECRGNRSAAARALGIGRFGIEVEHVFHARHILAIDLGDGSCPTLWCSSA